MGIVKDIKNLFKGLQITSRHLGRHAVTLQYPEEKMEMPARSRGPVVLLSDKETGDLNCTSCLLCMKACPTAAILIEAPRGEDKKRHLELFTVDHSICCFCGLCEEACNFSALKMAPQIYEFSTLNKEDLIWDMNKLQEMGRDVDYVDTRKKKKPKVVPPKEKPTESVEASKVEEPKAEIKTELQQKPEQENQPKDNGEDKV